MSARTDEARLASAYEACARLARDHYENFPVASRLLPSRMRPHVAAVYAFARLADDFADEGDLTPEERLRLLDDWGERLRAAAGGAAQDDVFLALGDTIERWRLPVGLLEDLLSAFAQDVTVKRYACFDDVLDYCRRSANPVGRIVLRIAGYDDPALDARSDALCTALQLANFWQDLAIDWRRGRLYVPMDVVSGCGADERHLAEERLTPAWREALSRVTQRTRGFFEAGKGVADGVSGRLRYELRATWLGGSRILDRLEQGGFDVFQARPSLGRRDLAGIAWRTLTWRRAPIGARLDSQALP